MANRIVTAVAVNSEVLRHIHTRYLSDFRRNVEGKDCLVLKIGFLGIDQINFDILGNIQALRRLRGISARTSKRHLNFAKMRAAVAIDKITVITLIAINFAVPAVIFACFVLQKEACAASTRFGTWIIDKIEIHIALHTLDYGAHFLRGDAACNFSAVHAN